jgi:hypothetical protein
LGMLETHTPKSSCGEAFAVRAGNNKNLTTPEIRMTNSSSNKGVLLI